MRHLVVILALAVSLLVPRAAVAFCGFYVSGADASMFNAATSVVLMRHGKRTVLSMQNNYQGPPEDFALVVPVPVVLKKDDVKTLPTSIFERVDTLAAPRLVEYWEQDPCETSPKGLQQSAGSGNGPARGAGLGTGSGYGRPAVEVEAQFAVGEYDVVILSAQDSGGLDAWLRENDYNIPAGAEPLLRPYVQGGSKFFVAKVDVDEVKLENGRAALSPLRFHYDADEFSLPVRLGLINSPGKQDLIVHILSPDVRYRVANYPNAIIPTNLDVTEATKAQFGAFYAALFDEAVGPKGDAVVTEYAWSAGGCDPCPEEPLTSAELLTLGADVLPDIPAPSGPRGGRRVPRIRMSMPVVKGDLPKEVVQRIVRRYFGRYRSCYETALGDDPKLEGGVTVKGVIGADGRLTQPTGTPTDGMPPSVASCVANAMADLSFPRPKGGKVTFTLQLRFSPIGATSSRPPPPRAGRFVLTRLHARYGKGELGADLVFEKAPAIEGGRERWSSGKLEQGAVAANINNFQARYAIRHAWKGPVECDAPQRGLWGGPPKNGDASAPTPRPTAARNLAFVPREGVKLASFLQSDLPPIDRTAPSAPSAPPPAASSPAPPTSPASPPSGGGCGCIVGGTSRQEGGLLWAMLALALGLLRRAHHLAK